MRNKGMSREIAGMMMKIINCSVNTLNVSHPSVSFLMGAGNNNSLKLEDPNVTTV